MVVGPPDLQELERRESFVRAYNRPFELTDPFTWPYPYKTAGATLLISAIGVHMHNVWNRKPFYFALFPRLIATAAVTALGYGLGLLREHHYRTRDAVIAHYISLHPEDFDHLKEFNGRPFSQILLPWYPKRAQYRIFD